MSVQKAYTPTEALAPVWAGDTIYHESVMYLEDEFSARLLHTPTDVFCVLSYDYTLEYQRGTDWEIDGDRLIRLPGSRMPAFPLNEYYPAEHEDWKDFGCTVEGHPYLKYGETDTFQKYQVYISYRHADTWTRRIPEAQSAAFSRFLSKLGRGEEATVVFYGDSITTGCNSTATFDHAPFTPSYPMMITTAVAEKYGYTVSVDADPNANAKLTSPRLSGERILHYVNTAVGGMESIWGRDNATERVSAHKPDLLVFAFGMNDAAKPADVFCAITAETVDIIRRDVPDVDICLVSTMLPHWRAAGFYGHQYTYEPAMEAYAATRDHMAVAPVTSMHASLLDKKEYYTMTGNNINHANDFLARVYAMTVLATLGI